MNNIILSFVFTFLAGFSTLIGTLFIFYKGNFNKLVKRALSFAAGVMLCVSLIDLIPESILLIGKTFNKNYTFIIITIYITVGCGLSCLINKLIPENSNVKDKKLYKVGIFSMLVIIIHNIPEGIATFLSSSANLSLGISLSIAIALHNIPEGISISVPIYSATGNKKQAIFYSLISALAEPLGAILAFLFLKPIITDYIMGCILALTAGIMIHISLFQLLPTSIQYKNKIQIFTFFILGYLIMLISIILMN